MTQKQWQFWIDRGGTFTDVVALAPDGKLHTHKLLSESDVGQYQATMQGIRDVLQLSPDEKLPLTQIKKCRLGSTVTTNALLERKGDRTALVVTRGFKDALRIAYQDRPDIFALNVILPEMLYEQVIEIDERMSAHGDVLEKINETYVREKLQIIFDDGIRSIAIVLLHSYAYSQHELIIEKIAIDIGFEFIEVSSKVSSLIKYIGRGDTTVLSAYLANKLNEYIQGLRDDGLSDLNVEFMQSNGGLIDIEKLKIADSLISGPAAGLVGAVEVARDAGFKNIVSFDMGGTSTDIALFDGEYKRTHDATVDSVRIRVPMLEIDTIAAGGGSICKFYQGRFQVGPESAGANPGPASYGKGGPLTITDCNVMLGKIQPKYFPCVFGKDEKQALDKAIVIEKFTQLCQEINQQTDLNYSTHDIAEGFLNVAIDNMANAIKRISIQCGHHVTDYVLHAFGGAAGQHACLIAEKLNIDTVLLSPMAGVLSAYGMGLARKRVMREVQHQVELTETSLAELKLKFDELQKQASQDLQDQGVAEKDIKLISRVYINHQGNNRPLDVEYQMNLKLLLQNFSEKYQKLYGFNCRTKH